MLRTASALARSTHPGPTVAVTAITVILGVGIGLDPWQWATLGAAFLLGQASVGLSNDWIDAGRDRAVGRTDKPVAAGLLSGTTARNAAIIAAAAAIALTVPLGWAATVAHSVFIASAWAYNLGVKSTALSVAPYIVSFGLLPLIVTLSRSEPAVASPWAMLAGALLGVSAHFANVLPDLDDDRATGVRGLPHRLGPRSSGLVVAGALAAASISIVVMPGPAPAYLLAGLALSLILAITSAVLIVRGQPTRLVFRIIILGALIDVVMLALSGARLLA
ncbi:4-hydroxybenzoate polyprenyltransferase [Salinibacterium sp. CAN_S4]|uniref:UbiA family prenyltransferase n=1 Tax=Salinibacterium sp. CAN_S4 TaxID=2787727 RepID=UPI0018F02001